MSQKTMMDDELAYDDQAVRDTSVCRDVARHLGEVIRGKRVHDLSCDPRVKLAVAFVVGERFWQTRWMTDAEVWQWLDRLHQIAVLDYGLHQTFGDLLIEG
ncbi:MAG: hypothetical protein O9256_00175 [Rhizobiaceae bacterium]|nr:hypothetical protein [Rhizobiaceae bacterium]